ncbi:MAG: flagellar hook-basal body complex protein FliE [Deltaproteobacteria bacterium]|nr:flagellar hook-basal body complex protein FliE [Deltaproteobacteria bacterium]MBW2138047.1 flagellar hook-basal body complex protein FliE [Deltaproteobacteria bacterium]
MGDLLIKGFKDAPPAQGISGSKRRARSDFGKIIKESINRVDTLEREADRSVIDLLQGKADIHVAMIALQKADTSMRILLTVRNKVIDAYREIMRMQF